MKQTPKSPLSTYNVEVYQDVGIIVVEASGCSISHSGALIFTGENGTVTRVFNAEIWKEAWKV